MGKNIDKKFHFTKWLTNRDIEKIVKELGYEIVTKKDDTTGKDKLRIIRSKTDEGYSIIVFCKDLIMMKEKSMINDILCSSKELGKIYALNTMLSAIALGMGMNNDFVEASNTIILNIDDYFIMESMSLKDEDAERENDRRMSKIYQGYMSKKFGKFYNNMKRAHYKTLHKELRKEDSEKELND